MQRVEIKKMLREWERQYPGRTETIFSSLRNVVPSHLADPVRHDFNQRPTPKDGATNDPRELFE
jgi:tRNA 2-thiocytidine biosynthesis protein TtcA